MNPQERNLMNNELSFYVWSIRMKLTDNYILVTIIISTNIKFPRLEIILHNSKSLLQQCCYHTSWRHEPERAEPKKWVGWTKVSCNNCLSWAWDNLYFNGILTVKQGQMCKVLMRLGYISSRVQPVLGDMFE